MINRCSFWHNQNICSDEIRRNFSTKNINLVLDNERTKTKHRPERGPAWTHCILVYASTSYRSSRIHNWTLSVDSSLNNAFNLDLITSTLNLLWVIMFVCSRVEYTFHQSCVIDVRFSPFIHWYTQSLLLLKLELIFLA